MATTRLSDVIVPQQWTPNFLLESPELVAFFGSGIVQADDVLGALAQGEGQRFTIRHLNDLDNDAENVSSDDPAVDSTPAKATTGAQTAIKLMRNKSWSSMDLVAALQNPDPVATIRSRVASYWSRRWQANAIAILNGILADNVANDSGDMRFNGSAAAITANAILDAKATMGDAAEVLDTIAMHSVPFTKLQKDQLIQYQRNADAQVRFPTYLGYRVVVDDGLPVDPNGGGAGIPTYTSVLFQSGALRLGLGAPKTPAEVERKPAAGNGEGEEILYSRQHWILHPRGFSYVAVGDNPTNATLATAATWNRIFPRKRIPLAFLVTR